MCALLPLCYYSTATGAELTVGTVLRSYSGFASASDSTRTTSVPLKASENGLGSLSLTQAWANRGGSSTRAYGDAAIAEITSSTNNSHQIHVATASRATCSVGPLYYSPTYATATAAVQLSAHVDLSAEVAPTQIVLTTSLQRTGTTHTGVLRIHSSLDGNLGQWSLTNRTPGKWKGSVSAGSVVTVSIEASSSSSRGPGTYAFTGYTDADSLDLVVGLNLYPQSQFRVFELAGDAENGCLIRWTSHPDFAYQVQYSDTLQPGDWHDIGVPHYARNGETSLSYRDTLDKSDDLPTPSHRFYRVQRK